MAATLTAAGTWTPLNVDFTKTPKTGPNLPTLSSMQLEQLKNVDLPELTQFTQLLADGYGIGYNAARALLRILVTAETNREDPMLTSGTTRTFG
jgi:hypothetical protein